MTTDETALTPHTRARPCITGTEVPIDGQTWLLATHVPRRDPVWDRLFDANQLAPHYDPDDLRMAGFRLLFANYQVTAEEGVDLIRRAALGDLVTAIEEALFGAPDSHPYSEWVQVSLWANGIDPDKLPPALVKPVLNQLVASGRAAPATEFVSSAEAAALRQSLMAIAGPGKAG